MLFLYLLIYVLTSNGGWSVILYGACTDMHCTLLLQCINKRHMKNRRIIINSPFWHHDGRPRLTENGHIFEDWQWRWMIFLFLFVRIAASGVAMNKIKRKNLWIRRAGRRVAPGSIAGLCWRLFFFFSLQIWKLIGTNWDGWWNCLLIKRLYGVIGWG